MEKSHRIEKHTILLLGNMEGLSVIFVPLSYVTSTCKNGEGRTAAPVSQGQSVKPKIVLNP